MTWGKTLLKSDKVEGATFGVLELFSIQDLGEFELSLETFAGKQILKYTHRMEGHELLKHYMGVRHLIGTMGCSLRTYTVWEEVQRIADAGGLTPSENHILALAASQWARNNPTDPNNRKVTEILEKYITGKGGIQNRYDHGWINTPKEQDKQ